MSSLEKSMQAMTDYDPNWYPSSKVQIALTLLSGLSGVPNLTAEHVLCKVNQPHVRLGDKGYTPFVAVCSSMKSSWDRRPSNAQLERLKGLIGKEPDWFVDVNPSSFYRDD
ncbi:hypothetical protein LshimejAT787_1500810 [Lyophyllum shimeji]|uniref:Uncharacterized protein n=1 Tax=Lyophyllum shimeji TaxID=47721 RepID=A0A9P3PVU6_LYOSH|nr:hypothetical protein LshimejAT787_1500810 [Lyophyllum shimeji]